MLSWLAPFAVLAVILALYYTSKGSARAEAMRRDLNYYMVCVLATAIIAVFAGARYDRDWLDTAAWLVAGIASGAAVFQWSRSGAGDD